MSLLKRLKLRKQTPQLSLSLNRWKVLISLSIILSASLFVRLHGLDSQSLDCEELFTIPAATGHHYVYLNSQMALRFDDFPLTRQAYTDTLTPNPEKDLASVTEVISRNVHLPAYFYLMHFWLKLAGTSEWVLRFPSVFFGTLSVLMIFLLSRELTTSFVGLVSAALVGFMPEQVYYSQEARMYTLLLFLVISSTYSLILAAKRPSAIWHYALYGLLSVIGLYTHYVYLFCFTFQTLYIWVESFIERRDIPPRRWLIVQVCVAVAFIPCLLMFVTQTESAPENLFWARANPSFGFILRSILSKLTRWIAVPELKLGWLNVAAAYLLLAFGVVEARANRKLTLLLAAWVCLPVMAITVADLLLGTRAISIPRYWMTITPVLYILMGIGFERLWQLPELRRRDTRLVLAGGVILLLVSAAIWTANGVIRRKPDEYRELAKVIDHQTVNDGKHAVLAEGTNAIPLALGYYARHDFPMIAVKWMADKQRQQTINEILGDANVWLVVSGESRVKVFLESRGYRMVDSPTMFGHIILYKFTALPKEDRTAQRR